MNKFICILFVLVYCFKIVLHQIIYFGFVGYFYLFIFILILHMHIFFYFYILFTFYHKYTKK